MVNEKRLLDAFIAMCRINTPPQSEKALVDLVQPELEELGFACVRDEAHLQTGGDIGNLIATMPATVTDAPSIFFSAHFDTVEPNPNVNILVENGIVKTDGTTILGADDKGGMSPIIEAMRVIMERNIPHGEIQLLFSVSEEIGLLGAVHMDKSLVKARMGFVLDTGPPVGTIVYAAPTHDVLEVRIIGQSAHAGFEPEKGVSAIQVAARAIENMKLGRIDAETTANIGVIQGGSATNVVCAEVKMRAETRSRSAGKVDAQVRHMMVAVKQAAEQFGAQAEIAVVRQYETYSLNEDAPVIQMAMKAAQSIGLAASLKAAGGGSDANVFNNASIPACVIGTGMSKVHTHDEYIAVSDLVRSAEWVLAIVRQAAGLTA